jgi:arginyl-tRNA synthetase (EC 6.1.1.19)
MELGDALSTQSDFVESYNVVKGFLNLKIKNSFFLNNFNSVKENFDKVPEKNETVMVEYSSPNTNKPLHLGHIRNNLLGFSVAQILKQDGYNVIKTQIINDRGIHICKSMLAWEKFGNGETPQSTNTKGDKFVGNYYVEFDKNYKSQIADLIANGQTEDEAKKNAAIIQEAQQMLLNWEKGRRKSKEIFGTK